jgi:hypothetical protein
LVGCPANHYFIFLSLPEIPVKNLLINVDRKWLWVL